MDERHRPQVAVVDDDYWTRAGIVASVDRIGGVDVVAVGTQTEAMGWTDELLDSLDVLLVDVHDESMTDVPGEDLYAGVAVLDRVRDRPVRTVALVPTLDDPLLGLRLVEAGVDEVYLRRELQRPDQLAALLRDKNPAVAPRVHPDDVLAEHGVSGRSKPNRAVGTYRRSPLFGRIAPEQPQKSLGVSRRQVGKLRAEVSATGFVGTSPAGGGPARRTVPRWPDTRDFLLKVLGRLPVQRVRLRPRRSEE